MDEETFRRAKRFDRPAVEAMLSEFYPFVTRVTLALTGRQDVGVGVARYVMKRSLHVLPKWQHAGDPPRWFGHHAIISTRRANRHKAYLGADTLGGPKPQPKYMAFIVALRDLPHQQREALILHDCERLDLRATAVAMDCSTDAASNHLDAARQQLRLIAGPDYERLAAALKRTYATLTPPEELRLPSVRRYVNRHLWPRRIKKFLTLLIVLAVLVGIYWALSHFGLIPDRYRITGR
jgi:DNA-directed RNA polymerase specialized sigma24 family protein